MFEIVNNTPFLTDGAVLLDKNGDKFWIVIVKATYDILDGGELKISENQKEVATEPIYRGEPGVTSLLYDTDIVLKKKTTDVLLNGSAYAPEGKTRNKVKVNLKVAGINKSLLVEGTRKWFNIPLFPFKTLMKPYSKMEIIYENSFGGTDTRDKRKRYHKKNPVGTGYVVWPWRLKGKSVPNISEGNIIKRMILNNPAGFGAIAPNWYPRIKFGGTYDKKWEETKKPLLADDFDERFYQQAPIDQQTKSYLKGSEIVELTNLSPERKLSFTIPRNILKTTTFFNNAGEESFFNINTLIIEPDDKTVSIVYHTSVSCQNRDDILNRTVIDGGMDASTV